MSFKKLLEEVRSDEDQVWEAVGTWMGLDADAKAEVIREVKEGGNKHGISFLKSIGECATILLQEESPMGDFGAEKGIKKAAEAAAKDPSLKEKIVAQANKAKEGLSSAAKKAVEGAKEYGGKAVEGTKKFAGEHGGKVAAATAAGLGALALVKAMRRKKAPA